MVIYGVSFDMVGKQPIVLLKAVDTNKFLPIWIGHPEAAAILMKLQGATTPRPMTHDLLVDMLGELEARCTQVAVTELRDNTFFASITLAIISPGGFGFPPGAISSTSSRSLRASTTTSHRAVTTTKCSHSRASTKPRGSSGKSSS